VGHFLDRCSHCVSDHIEMKRIQRRLKSDDDTGGGR
jgi:hypothetical protein